MRFIQEEDYQVAARFLFLSMAIVVIDQDMQIVQNGPFKIKEPYLKLLQTMAASARKERKALRKKMKDQDIQVVRLNQNDSFTTYQFICRGKEESKSYFNPVIRKKVELILEELIADSLQQYRPSASSDGDGSPLNT